MDWVERIVDGTPKPRQFFKFRGALSGPTSSTKLREETVRPVRRGVTVLGYWLMSALPPKADIGLRRSDVRFVPKADIRIAAKSTLLDHLVGAGEQGR